MVYWVEIDKPGRLGIMPRPRGGDWLADDLRRLREEGVQVLVSLLDTDETQDLELDREEELATAEALCFLAFPIPDREVPRDSQSFRSFVANLTEQVSSGKSVAIHCRAGIGRSSVLAASVLAAVGIPVAEAFRLLCACRGLDVPDTPEQRQWVERFVDSAASRA